MMMMMKTCSIYLINFVTETDRDTVIRGVNVGRNEDVENVWLNQKFTVLGTGRR
jgi:hypothetical protein